MSPLFYINPSKRQIETFIKKHPDINPLVCAKLSNENIRIEFHKHEKYVFLIFYIPEYSPQTKTIESVELNVFYDRERCKPNIFAFRSLHFFSKYKQQLALLPDKPLSAFIEEFLSIVLEDEARIIEHILRDTRGVRQEYKAGTSATQLIRHLTNNLINITTLKLIVDNQDKLLDKAEAFIRNYENSPIHYQRTYISEELVYVKEFCETLMTSLNTKFQVRMSETLYAYTRYTFVFFLFGAVVECVLLFLNDSSPIRLTFWFVSLVTMLGTLLMFRKFR
jgi:hypothetical protein